jgi:hypothetical protein
MPTTLAFAPDRADLEEFFFDVPVIVWTPPETDEEDDDDTPVAA